VPMESDGRPRGSFNRWNYNEVYHPATSPSNSVERQRESESVLNSDSHYNRWRQSQRLRGYSTTVPPTPGRHVELDAKHDVDWAYDTLSFYLRVCIKYAIF